MKTHPDQSFASVTHRFTSTCLAAALCSATVVCAAPLGESPDGGTRIEQDAVDGIASDAAAGVVHPHLLMLRRQLDLAATPAVSNPSSLSFGSTPVVDGLVRIEAMSNGDDAALIQELKAAGVVDLKQRGNVVVGRIAPAAIDALTHLTTARFVRPPAGRIGATGAVTSQGDSAQRSQAARQTYGVDGKGVTVGVISTSFNTRQGAAKNVSAGELPGVGNPFGHTTPVQVLKDLKDDDEGRAMLQIVHDVAPASKLAFYAPEDVQDHAAGLRALAAAGARVISDDLFWFDDPWFQEGPINVAQRELQQKNNAVTVTIAGNWGADSVDTTFRPTELNYIYNSGKSAGLWRLHDWGLGHKTVPVTIPRGGNIRFVLQWDEPFASYSANRQGAKSDLDLFLFSDPQGVNMLFSSTDRNVGADPFEQVYTFLDSNATAQSMTVYLGVGQPNKIGATPGRFKIVAFDRGAFAGGVSSTIPRDTVFNKSTVIGHHASEWAVTACAVRYDLTNASGGPVVESFSSVGGFARTRDSNGNPLTSPVNTNKPDVCGPDGVNTTFFGSYYVQGRDGVHGFYDIEADGIPNFYGTSAASPHVAGVAALMLQASNMKMSASAIGSTLKSTALDMNDPRTLSFDRGYDVGTGMGFIQADKAVKAALTFR